MKTKFYQIVFLCLAFVGLSSAVNAQTLSTDYDPFTTGKVSLTSAKVVSGSYLRYRVPGDQGFGTEVSQFVWYIEGGKLGTYSGGSWIPIVAGDLTVVGTGQTATLNGNATTQSIDGVDKVNWSEIWVKWDDDLTAGYIAVYELSPNGCIANNAITGFNVSNLDVINAWFTQAAGEVCSTDEVILKIALSIDPTGPDATKYYPVTVAYSDNTVSQTPIEIASTDVKAEGSYFVYEVTGVHQYIVAADEVHTFLLDGITDVNGASGNILHDTADPKSHFNSIAIDVHRLPTIGTMVQN